MKILEQESVIDKCQIFTPDKYATELLDYVGYKKNLFGKKILENSCGDGGILKVIVKRYIKSLKKYKSITEIKEGLENDIYGVELDEKHYNKCLESLDNVAIEFGIKNVKWNIINKNTLKIVWDIKFDYVVGNPPYISHKEIGKTIRDELKKKYISCRKGKFDYCYAFIEESLNSLSPTGKFAYLIPNSIFKNVFGKELRKLLLPTLTKIIDYKSHRIFKNALTTSAILICDKNKKSKYFKYFNFENATINKIEKEKIKNKWIFEDIELSRQNLNKFGDYFNASMSVATLYNKAYVLKKYKEDDQYIYISDMKIEKSIVKKGASPLGIKKGLKEYIIFPYNYLNDKLIKYSIEEFENNYPETKKYLLSHSKGLKARAADKQAKWFEYGRSQALQHLNGNKILMSSLITNKVESYLLNEDYIPYSGIYIISKGTKTLEEAKAILESKDFFEYVKKIGKNANGKTLRITAKDINNYIY